MILSAQWAINARLENLGDKPMCETDTYISYLPGAHSFEQNLIAGSLIYGVKMGFYAGDPKKLIDDIAILKPTMFPSVPRVYNLIYGKIVDKFSKETGLKKYLIDSAVNSKLWYLKDG